MSLSYQHPGLLRSVSVAILLDGCGGWAWTANMIATNLYLPGFCGLAIAQGDGAGPEWHCNTGNLELP